VRKLPALTAAEVEGALLRMGFEISRSRGSHRFFRHADGRVTTVPFHSARNIAKPLLRQILRDIDVTPETFLKALT